MDGKDMADVVDKEKKYLVRAFDSNKAIEDFANEAWPAYAVKSFTDTNRYITALLERNDGE